MARFNREIKQQVKASLPLAFAKPEDPLLGATLIGVVVRDGEAKVDDAVLHGRSDIERGIRFGSSAEGLEIDECHFVVYVAMRQEDGGLRYRGATASELLIDRKARRGVRDIALAVNRMSEAVSGEVALDALPASDRAAVARLLEERGRDAWERTPEQLRRRIRGEA